MKINIRLFSIIGIIIFACILWNSDINKIFTFLSQINMLLLLAGFFVSFIAAYIKSEKWRLLLRIAEQKYGSWRAFVVWMISFAYGFITPARAGDFVRVFYLQHDIKLSKAKGFIICFLDRLLDLSALLFSGLVFYTIVFQFPKLLFVLFITGIIGLYVVLLLTDRHIHLFPAKISDFYKKAKSFVKSVSRYYSLQSLFIPFLMSVIAWFFSFLQMYIVIIAANKAVPYLVVGAGVAISLIVALLPVSIGGLGTTELVFFTIFQVFTMEEIVAMTFVFNLISLWLPSLVGFVLSISQGVKMEL